jgi:hypothetical protein
MNRSTSPTRPQIKPYAAVEIFLVIAFTVSFALELPWFITMPIGLVCFVLAAIALTKGSSDE